MDKSKDINLWDYFIVFIMIYVSGKTLVFSTNANVTYIVFYDLFPFFFLPLLYFFAKYKRKQLLNKSFTRLKDYFLSFVFLIFFSAVVNIDLRGGYVITILLFLAGFLYVSVVPLKTFLTIFEKIVWWIAFLSIIFFLAKEIYPGLLNYFPVVTNTRDFPFANCFVSVFPLVETSAGLRLFGPFSEPGVYQIYLNLGLLFSIFLTGRLELKRGVVYIIAIILTQSTAGYFCLGVFLLYYILESKNSRNKVYNYTMSLIIIIAVIFAYTRTALLSAESDVFVKLSDENISTISRMASLKINFEIFLSHPIFGVGLTEITELFTSKCKSLYGFSEGIANTNSILYQLAAFGPIYVGLWLYSFYLFFRRFCISQLTKLLVFVGAIMLFSSEMMTGCLMLYVFLGYGLLDKGKVTSEKVNVR